MPDIPLGPLYRVWLAFRQNPCTIEKLYNLADAPAMKVRIRNDNPHPTAIQQISVDWKLKGEKDFTVSELPMDVILSRAVPGIFPAAMTTEIGILPSTIEGEPVEVRIEVRHNRGPQPERKTFKVRYDKNLRRWKWG